MKTFFKVVLFVFVAAFYSCGKDEVSSASSSITSAGVISGTISNYSTTKVSSILFNDKYSSEVSSEGKFTCNLGTPELSELSDLSELSTLGLVVSDPKAMAVFLNHVPYFNEVHGDLIKTNITENMTPGVGAEYSTFIYCDRDITIKGNKDGYVSGLGVKMIFDVKLKKGWNEMVGTIEKVSLTSGEMTMNISNNIPSDLKWIADMNDTAGTASKVKAFKSLLK